MNRPDNSPRTMPPIEPSKQRNGFVVGSCHPSWSTLALLALRVGPAGSSHRCGWAEFASAMSESSVFTANRLPIMVGIGLIDRGVIAELKEHHAEAAHPDRHRDSEEIYEEGRQQSGQMQIEAAAAHDHHARQGQLEFAPNQPSGQTAYLRRGQSWPLNKSDDQATSGQQEDAADSEYDTGQQCDLIQRRALRWRCRSIVFLSVRWHQKVARSGLIACPDDRRSWQFDCSYSP